MNTRFDFQGRTILLVLALIGGQAEGVECEPYTFVVYPDPPARESDTAAYFVWHVLRIGDPTKTVSVNYATQDLTATAGQDYQAVSGTITFGPNVLTARVLAKVYRDAVIEPPETAQLILSGKGTQPPATNGIGTIVDDTAHVGTESAPIVVEVTPQALNAVAYDGGGSARNRFTIALSTGNPATPVTVSYRTEDLTAKAGVDYYATSGSVTLRPDQSVIVDVNIKTDHVTEGVENYKFVVTTPSTVNGIKEAVGIIADSPNDLAP